MEAVPNREPLAGLTVVRWGNGPAVAYAIRLLSALGARVALWPVGDASYRDEPVHEWLRWPAEPVQALGARDEDGGTVIVLANQLPVDGHALGSFPTVVLTPFGLAGPTSRWVGADIVVQAFGGLCGLIGDPTRTPLYIPYEFAHLQLGLHGAVASVAVALSPPPAIGTPRRVVDISGADVLASYTRMYSMLYRQYEIRPSRSGRRAPGSGTRYPFGIFPCRDGYVVLIGRYPEDWNRYLEMMGQPDWAQAYAGTDEFLLATRYADALDAQIIPWLKQHSREELAVLGRRHGLPIAPVRAPAEVLEDSQMAFRQFFVTYGGVKMPGMPARVVFPQAVSGSLVRERGVQ